MAAIPLIMNIYDYSGRGEDAAERTRFDPAYTNRGGRTTSTHRTFSLPYYPY
jgi:hypothetical protein